MAVFSEGSTTRVYRIGEGSVLMNECLTCNQLWGRHTSATREHLLLQNKLRIATVTHKYDALRDLKTKLEASRLECVRLRAAIRQHDATLHAGVMKAG